MISVDLIQSPGVCSHQRFQHLLHRFYIFLNARYTLINTRYTLVLLNREPTNFDSAKQLGYVDRGHTLRLLDSKS